ncbi:MAG: mannose-1-phosphate guanylyltransferase, partial [Paramuribaculum sp.]|nr:mannose-1-phosphate guanylyltransferase [Paramuribaculum sp.]
MKIILLSGGAGKRLWPLSNSVRAKQFLKLLTSPSGRRESMIQRIVRQIRTSGLAEEIVVATGLSQIGLIERQLGNKQPIVTEPARKDTFPAVYLACLFLYQNGTPRDEPILVLPCDTYASDGYFSALSRMGNAVNDDSAANMVLLGVKPTYPSSKYGYIIPEKDEKSSTGIRMIKSFVEKPDVSEASILVQEGALWNTGVCGFKLDYLLKLGCEVFKTMDYSIFREKYSELPKLNFSYEVLAKGNNKAVVEYDGDWNDIGTWNSLTSEMKMQEIGKVISEDCHESMIINDLNIPLVCVGCDNKIVVASSEGILVADKEQTENIRHLVDQIVTNPINYSKLCDNSKEVEKFITIKGTSLKIRFCTIPTLRSLDYHINEAVDELWIIIGGTGELSVESHIFELTPMSVV